MKELVILGVVGFAVYFFLIKAEPPAAGHANWTTDFESALEMAKDKNRPLLVNFTGSDWCGYCIKLEKEVFGTAEFEAWSSTNVIPVMIDFPKRKSLSKELQAQNNALASKYGIQGFPTILFISSEGKVMGRSGYLGSGVSGWIQDAEKQLKIN